MKMEMQEDTNADASTFTVWSVDEFNDSRMEEALLRIAAVGAPLPPFAYFKHGSGAQRAWDKFYHTHAERFFKERHYLERDFPSLLEAASRPISLLEIGCGTGAAFFPLLASLPRLTVTACDLSKHAIANIRSNPLYSSTGRVCAFVHDAAEGDLLLACQREHELAGVQRLQQDGVGDSLEGKQAVDACGRFDCVLLLFMLSAMPPEAHAPILADAARCLKPGGLLLVRDYGWLDEAQLRFPKGSKLDPEGRLCVRGDGTLAYYFQPVELAAHAAQAGLEVDWRRVSARHPAQDPVEGGAGTLNPEVCVTDGQPCSVYLYRKYKNRAAGLELRRVFVHAVFRKPRE